MLKYDLQVKSAGIRNNNRNPWRCHIQHRPKNLVLEYCRFLMCSESNLQESSQLHTNLPLSLSRHLKALLLIIHEGIFNLFGMSFYLSLLDFREKA